MVYEDFKDLNRRTVADKVLRDKPLNIAKNSKYDGYELDLASMVDKFLIKNPLFIIKNWLKNYKKQLLGNLIKEKGTHFLQAIFGVQILQICNWLVNLSKYLNFYYVLLTLIASMHELFL